MTPSILLIRPQMGENIGAAARAMANFGLHDLRLVLPRDGWPNPKASDTAGKALNLIDDASVHETVSAALADCQFVLATTARERAMNLPVMEAREAMAELRVRAARGEKCAVMFGPERTGLSNEDMALADAVVTIPVAPEYTSLNIGQAVVVCAYEWWMGQSPVVSPQLPVGVGGATGLPPLPAGEATRLSERSELSRSGEGAYPRVTNLLDNESTFNLLVGQNSDGDENTKDSHPPSAPRPHPDFLSAGALENPTSPVGRGALAAPLVPATRAQLEGLLGQLEAALDAENFWRVPEKKDVMWRNIRGTLIRAGLTEQEIATWRGMVKALRSQ